MVTITRDPIDVNFLLKQTFLPDCGATVIFLGTVREITGLTETKFLTYEAYESMALKQMETIAENALLRWKLGKVKLIHRIGLCKPMEIVVAIIATAPHRSETFTACSWMMDEIKKIVPIWKEETDSLNNSRWIHPGLK